MDIDFLDHLISIISGIFILIVSGYTAYLTFFCERIKIIGYRKIDDSSENPYSQIKIQIYNPSLSVVMIRGLYVIYAGEYLLPVKKYDIPIPLEARTSIVVSSDKLYDISENLGQESFVTNSIILLSILGELGTDGVNKRRFTVFRVKDLKERWKYWWKRYWWRSNRYYKDNFKYISYTTEMGKSMYKGSIDDSACTYETHIYC